MAHILDDIASHLKADAGNRIVVGVQGGYRAPVYAAKDLPKMRADGSGVRIGRTFIFATQIRFARLA